MIDPRLMRLAHAIDFSFFAAALAYLAAWGWPATLIGWGYLISAVIPFSSWAVWRLIRGHLDTRAVRRTMAYRREKFGGYVRQPGRPDVTPIARPRKIDR